MKQVRLLLARCGALGALVLGTSAFAHPREDPSLHHPPAEPTFFLAQATPRAPESKPAAAPAHRVNITIEGSHRVIRSNGWPDHPPGEFPRRGNPHTAQPQDYTFRVALDPKPAASTQAAGGWFFAVAVNGVPFEPGTAENWNNDPASGWRYEAATGFLDLGLDEHQAHVQPNGAYHYHALPTGLVKRLGGDGKRMLLIAWAADGFPVYTSYGYADPQNPASPLRPMRPSYRLKTGARPAGGPAGAYDGRFTQDWEFAPGRGDLDECNGRFGVTPEFPQGIYHYYITTEFPFVARQWRGAPDVSFAKAGGALPGGGRRARPPEAFGASFDRFNSEPGRPGRPLPPVQQALDRNRDGEIDEAEIAAAAASLRLLDRDGNGRLTQDELRPPGGRPIRPPGDAAPGERRGPPR